MVMNKIAIASSVRSSQSILGSSADHTNVLHPIDHCIHRIVYRCIQTNVCYPIHQFIHFISRHNFSKVCVRSSQILWLLRCLKTVRGSSRLSRLWQFRRRTVATISKIPELFLGFLTAGCKTSFPSHSAPAWLNISFTSARCGAVTGKRRFTLP